MSTKLFGVDLSEHNGNVNFTKLSQAGVKFVILRLGYGSDYKDQDDSKFETYVKGAESVGIPWGAYLYSYATNESMARSEAEHTRRLLNGRKPQWGLWYDMEDPSTTSANLNKIAKTYCDEMEADGLYTGIYASTSFFNSYLTSSELDKFDKWVAQYNSTCQYTKPYGIWQYTSKYTISDHSCYFDGNWSYKDYKSIISPSTDDDIPYEEFYSMFKISMNKYNEELAKEPVPSWAREIMQWSLDNGIYHGDGKGTSDIDKLRPRSDIKRDEMATIIMNFVKSL